MLKSIEAVYHDGTVELKEIPPNIKTAKVIVVFLEEQSEGKLYDFSDIAGKLVWKGDPVAMQRKLRDEW